MTVNLTPISRKIAQKLHNTQITNINQDPAIQVMMQAFK